MSDEPTEIPLAELIAAADEVNDPAVFRVLDIVIAKRKQLQQQERDEPRPAA